MYLIAPAKAASVAAAPCPLAQRGAAESEVISLRGSWDYKVELALEPKHPDWGTRPEAVGVGNQNNPGVLYNAMIAPLVPFAIRGFIWYQGESNAGRAYQYRTLFPTMIRNWRTVWGHEFPFYFVQLANWHTSKSAPEECFAHLESLRLFAERANEVELALWFHEQSG